MAIKPMRVGVVGSGIISRIYLENMIRRFRILEVGGVCSAHFDNAKRRAEEFGLPAMTFEEMLAAYREDVVEIEAGDAYGNNIVELYDPLNYIGGEGTRDPVWARILMGASEGDISMFISLNLEIAWLNAGTDAEIEWQWDGGHVPSEILGDSFALYVDTMYGKYADGGAEITRSGVEPQTANGTADEPTGTDLSGWVSYDREKGVSFSLADAAAYRTAKASKAIPGFDVMDYGQEDYVFGSAEKDARHWNKYVLSVFEENADTLSKLFNAGT